MRSLHGRARRFGDDINTDYIIASTRKKETLDESVLARYLMEAIDPAFAATVRPGDLIVAGRNFGCGSAMEIAVTVILAAGIKAVLATTFARTFYRNAINNGLLPIECDTSGMHEGDTLAIDVGSAGISVANQTTGRVAAGLPLPSVILEIYQAGGLVPYLRARQKF
jgi:3-isopropylmalate/(R)-2-methylmalate dehydratase small subunit